MTHHSRLYIVGAGSVGLLLGAKLRLSFPNYPVTLLLRQRRGNEDYVTVSLRENNVSPNVPPNLSLHRLSSSPRWVRVPARSMDDGNESIRHLIVTTKAGDAVTAIQSLMPRINQSPFCRVLVLCNGALCVQQDLAFLTSSSVMISLGINTHGVHRSVDKDDDICHVVHAGMGEVLVPQDWDWWARDVSVAGLGGRMEANMETNLWRKLAVNCVINPLTALFRCRNGALLPNATLAQTITTTTAASTPESLHAILFDRHQSLDAAAVPDLQPIMAQVCHEVAAVAQYRVPDNASLSTSALHDYTVQVLQATAHNYSSMYQDTVMGRTTEVDYLNGYVVRQAQQFQVPCPMNRYLWEQVRALSHDVGTSQT
jgi:2-dehydropantoate 2-reductase